MSAAAGFRRIPSDIISYGERRGLSRRGYMEMAILFALFTTMRQSFTPGVLLCAPDDLCGEFGWDRDDFLRVWEAKFERKIATADWTRGIVYIPLYIRRFAPRAKNHVLGWRKQWRFIPDCEFKDWIASDLRSVLATLGPAKSLVAAFDSFSNEVVESECECDWDSLDSEINSGLIEDQINFDTQSTRHQLDINSASPLRPVELEQKNDQLRAAIDEDQGDRVGVECLPGFDLFVGESANGPVVEMLDIPSDQNEFDTRSNRDQINFDTRSNGDRLLDQLDQLDHLDSLDHKITTTPPTPQGGRGAASDSGSKSNSKPKAKRTRTPEVQLEHPEASRRVAEQVSEIRKLVSRGSARGISTPLKSELGHIDERLVELTSELGSIDAAETRLVDVYKARAWKLGIAPTFKSGSSYEAWRASYKFLNIHSPLTGPGKGPGGWAMSLDVMREWEEHGCPDPAEVQITDEEKKQQEYEHFEKHILPEQIKIQRANQEQKLAEVRERLNAKPKEEAYVPF